MPRLRSLAVIVLLWSAALAGSSAPDGFGGPSRATEPLVALTVAGSSVAAATAGAAGSGTPSEAYVDPAGKRWE